MFLRRIINHVSTQNWTAIWLDLAIVVVGVFGEKPTIDLGLVQDRELSLVGTLMYQKPDYAKAIELIAAGKIQLDNLITHRFKFDHYLDAYHTIEAADGHYMKVMIELD